ncbi:enoyl-CoA hydratase-related protein [Caenibacillus caldisaponilyticus]|jgi:enoyl-CoA hydratase|uniref:enoyl-CoA hydratase-related protein n=1 Tax=Caenibacillus caldisaponilyticus TaxID=1674942 RepID=UPI0009885FF7|nr:enoyl-CoA hydratase-related protein [Caenibacillus caldisaponilyticus]
MATVLFEKKNGIGYVTIHRPEVMNSFNYSTLLALEEIVEALTVDNEVRVVIFTGAGDKAFSAGADLKERRTLSEQEVRRNVKKIGDVFQRIDELPQPTIAAINGYAFGGGFELALACDFRIAARHAQIGLTETSMAIIPGAGGTQRLPRLIGTARALELILTAKKLTAEEALAYGILTRVVDGSELMAACEAFAAAMLKNGPIALQQAKFAIKQGMDTDLKTGLKIESKAYEVTIPTKDRVEALQAFSEKRPPRFTGE